MFKQTKNKCNPLRFKRWSRKSYAIFASLNKVVSIGALVVSVADKSLVKATGHISSCVSNLLMDFQEPSDPAFDEFETASSNCIILQTLSTQQRTDAAAAGVIGIYSSKRATYKGESPRMIALFLSQKIAKTTVYQSYALFPPLLSRFTEQAYVGWGRATN